ncbi:hypothetical protein SAMN05660649_01969 [Desulfotomaculum arcticum]|uniref:Uncharacterized protein n=1 Tax=Desulfotruncus arcticus DSM 17038 TaxID=1121424 RepID=A0A1I2SRX7_9FIRM|nr:hypothetical protein [Desulfotruncus arcticus]SFG55460.1 hypothetical protein SAMN05660649_01969 [Desulfotomaculum arcticum] [Desulfotruncus arcticus DSM 17038]
MSSISQTGENCHHIESASAVVNFLKPLVTFFKSKSVTRTPRIYHGDYSYQSMPDMAFVNFMHMKNVTFVETGDCYVYIFDEPQYQGNYIIAGPKEVVPICKCGSIIISQKKLPVSIIQKDGKPPKKMWEVSGASYQYHCCMGYKFV